MASSGAEHARQDFVVDFYELNRLLCDVGAGGRHGCYGMALVEDLVPGEDVVPSPPQAPVVSRIGKVFSGQDGLHPFQGFGFTRVDRLDPGMRVGAAQDLPVQR